MGRERGFSEKPSKVALHFIIAVQQQSIGCVLLSAQVALLKSIAFVISEVCTCTRIIVTPKTQSVKCVLII